MKGLTRLNPSTDTAALAIMARKEPPSEAPVLSETPGPVISSRGTFRCLADLRAAAFDDEALTAIRRVRRACCASSSVDVSSDPPFFAYKDHKVEEAHEVGLFASKPCKHTAENLTIQISVIYLTVEGLN